MNGSLQKLPAERAVQLGNGVSWEERSTGKQREQEYHSRLTFERKKLTGLFYFEFEEVN